jgi:hypothetical protein
MASSAGVVKRAPLCHVHTVSDAGKGIQARRKAAGFIEAEDDVVVIG